MTRKRPKPADANVVWDAEDDGNAGSTAQPACGFQGTPLSAMVYVVPEFIWGMSDKWSYARATHRYRKCNC